jgi:outer membrane protein TolC
MIKNISLKFISNSVEKIIFCFLFLSCIYLPRDLTAQETKKFTLNDVLALAKSQSPDALKAKHRYRSNYWEYRSYKAGYLPSLSMDATIPDVNRSISKVTLPDGSDAFKRRSLTNSSVNMALTKNIGFTGGQLFLSSGVQRMDNFTDSTMTSYLSTPINIGFRQPLLGYNQYRWEKKIEPLKYDEAKRQYLEDVEELSITATNLFFELLKAQVNIEINSINQANNDTLFKIAQGRYNLGKIAENELLQMELSLLNSNSELEQSKIDYEAALFKMKSYLGIKDNEKVDLVLPTKLYEIQIDYKTALDQAKANRSDELAFERAKLEAQSAVNKSRAENRFNANLYAIYGLTQSAAGFTDVYKNPQDQQQFSIGIQVPILDWGVGKGKVKMAESNYDLVKTTVAQEEVDFEQEIFLKVMDFNMKKSQLLIAAKADTVGEKRFMVAKQRYLIGKIDITELNIAQSEKDVAKKSYFNALQSFWKGLYEMRKLTLFDFIENKAISYDYKLLQ